MSQAVYYKNSKLPGIVRFKSKRKELPGIEQMRSQEVMGMHKKLHRLCRVKCCPEQVHKEGA